MNNKSIKLAFAILLLITAFSGCDKKSTWKALLEVKKDWPLSTIPLIKMSKDSIRNKIYFALCRQFSGH